MKSCKTTTMPHASIESIGENIGRLIEGHMDLTFREVLRGPNCVAESRFVRLITGEPHPFGNFALIADTVDPDATAAAISPLLNCAAPSAALYVGAVTAAVDELLKSAGFEPHGGMPAMAVDIENVQPTHLPPHYTFVRVGSGDEGDAWTEAFAIGYELPYAVAEVFSPNVVGATTADDAAMQYFAIVKDGKPVCTSLAYLNDGVAGVYCVATLPSERGKGLGAHATAEPLRMAHKLGYRVGVLQSSPAGHAMYQRLGFTEFGEVPLYVKAPA